MSEKIKDLLGQLDEEITKLNIEIERKKGLALDALTLTQYLNIDITKIEDFLKSPYVVIPKGDNESYVIVPKFIDLHVGWLERQTPAFNIFRVSRYTDWFSPIPQPIRDALEFQPTPHVTVNNEYMMTPPDKQDDLFRKYRKYLRLREGQDKIRIRPRAQFNLISSLIKDGILPFDPHPVENQDILDRQSGIQLTDYQKDAFQKFINFGNIGVFWMPSAGKTYLGLYIMNMLKGKKLIVVPSLTLVEQWQNRIKALTSIPSSEYRIITYYSAHKVLKEDFVLTIYDECHHLPANYFSRLALIKTKYRLGLSATPFREDGRNELIFALTGFPVGLDWKNLIELRGIKIPSVKLILSRNITSKLSILDDLIRNHPVKKAIVFSDSIRIGKELGNRYNAPFIYSQTKKRLNRIQNSSLIIASRVADEGISLENLNRVIEFDFLFGSRRQELQRLGRLFHSAFKGEHIVLMTNEEYSAYKKRLFSIYEKGIEIEIEQR